MVVKKFYGKTTREALRQVRDELGTDALILSNRSLADGGVEIMAVADADVSSLASSLASHVKPPPRPVSMTPPEPCSCPVRRTGSTAGQRTGADLCLAGGTAR